MESFKYKTIKMHIMTIAFRDDCYPFVIREHAVDLLRFLLPAAVHVAVKKCLRFQYLTYPDVRFVFKSDNFEDFHSRDTKVERN